MKKKFLQLKLTLAALILLCNAGVFASDNTKVAFITTFAEQALIEDDDEIAAAEWFVANYPNGEVVSTVAIEDGSVDLFEFKTLWVHIDRVGDGALPGELLTNQVLNAINDFYKNGGNLLLTNHATQYVSALGRIATNRKAGIIGAGGGFDNGDTWALNANIGLTYDHYSHMIFHGIALDSTIFNHPVIPLIGGGYKEDHNSMWDLNSYGYSDNTVSYIQVSNATFWVNK